MARWHCVLVFITFHELEILLTLKRYAFSATFAAQNIAAAQHSRFWGLSQTWQTIVFYILAPIVTLLINLFGVFVSHFKFGR